MRPRWTHGPSSLVLVRHGQSVGNEADERAREAGAEVLDLDERDADVELSATGREQAEALGGWLRHQAEDAMPTVAVSSPYLRAKGTARLALDQLGDGPDLELDERLRERDLGIFDGLTGAGIRSRHPDEATRRRKLGKFYYQPPSGESWANVAQRVRLLLDDLRHGYDDERVWLFTHQAVIMTFRYVLDGLSEEEVLELDRSTRIPNASVTTFRRRGRWLELDSFADTSAVDGSLADLTHEAGKAERA